MNGRLLRDGRIRLTKKQRRRLERRTRRRTCSYRFVARAMLVLRLAVDPCVRRTAQRFNMDPKTVRLWRHRYLMWGVKGLKDLPRSGRPPAIDPVARVLCQGMACGSPADFGIADRNRWSYDALLGAFRSKYPAMRMSRSSFHRILTAANIRPHRVKMWLHSPDKNFRPKVKRICDLYLNPPPDAIVLCIDEKPGMQALNRRFPVRSPVPGRLARFEYEYKRHGTRVLIAAFEVHTGRVYYEVRPRRTADDLVEFMENVAKAFPKKKIYVIWDNLNIHYDGKSKRWTTFNRRHRGRFHFVYTPLHASWVNQVEIFFSIVARRVLRYGIFTSVKDLERQIRAFIDHWNRVEAHPFRWTFKGYPLQIGRAA
jgi:transposase